MKHLKKFETATAYNAAILDLPNVSLIEENMSVSYNPYVPETRVVAKYNVTTENKTQMILGYYQTGQFSSAITNAFTSVYVDGNEIEISDANIKYTFDTVGEHIVKYELKDPTIIKMAAFNGFLNGTRGVDAVSIIIPNTVTSIGGSAFTGCSSLTSIVIPDSVTSIVGSAFANCSSLTSINIPSGVTSIDISTFNGCTSLTSIEIPNGVTSIDSNAFAGCSGLTSIVVNATTAPTIQANTFKNIKTNGTLYVPVGSTGYDTWMGTGDYYLGKYGWTKVEK